ncbi:MAG: hypothetical protein QOD81_529, partial [Solirubrobacteraceae bacterium]|nr:hypothetical protein [Solirubrobacteraceae bacterium]
NDWEGFAVHNALTLRRLLERSGEPARAVGDVRGSA